MSRQPRTSLNFITILKSLLLFNIKYTLSLRLSVDGFGWPFSGWNVKLEAIYSHTCSINDGS